jgi:hypothetical protein
MLEIKASDFASKSIEVGSQYRVTIKHIPTGRTESSMGDNEFEVRMRLMDALLQSLLQEGEI